MNPKISHPCDSITFKPYWCDMFNDSSVTLLDLTTAKPYLYDWNFNIFFKRRYKKHNQAIIKDFVRVFDRVDLFNEENFASDHYVLTIESLRPPEELLKLRSVFLLQNDKFQCLISKNSITGVYIFGDHLFVLSVVFACLVGSEK